MRVFGYTLFVIGIMALTCLLAAMVVDIVGVEGGRAIAIGPSDSEAFVLGLPIAVGGPLPQPKF